VLRATKIAEEAGIPGVAVISSGFMSQARATAQAMGAPDLCIAEYPGVIPVDPEDKFSEKISTRVLPSVIDALEMEIAVSAPSMPEPGPRDIVFRGTPDAIQEYFEAREWTDGLPIVPPTRERVAKFLAWTERDSSEILGVLPPEFREATVWSVAVNGVMAGCRPEYMPVLVAAVEAIADPEFSLGDAGSTPGWEPLIVVSGEIAAALNFNSGGGNMRVGRRANVSIGRFLRLYMRNVAGFRLGTTDKASIGFTFNVAMAESEDAIQDLGWDPLRIDLGYGRNDNVVMVQSVVAISAPIYTGGVKPETLALPLLQHMTGTPGPYNYTAMVYGRWHPLIEMSPSVARTFAEAGWGKAEIRRHLFEHCKADARTLEHHQFHVGGQEFSFADLVQRGVAPAVYAESDDPNRKVPVLLREEWTNIVVAGDPARNQSRIYFNNHDQGTPIVRRVQLPTNWRERLAAAQPVKP